MKSCIVAYNKVTGDVTITRDAANTFHKTLSEYHNQVSVRAYMQREFLMDNPSHELTKVALELNQHILKRIEGWIAELKEVTCDQSEDTEEKEICPDSH